MARPANLRDRTKPASAMPPAEFRQRLRDLGVSYAWLARQLGKAPQTVSQWANGGLVVPQYAAFVLTLMERIKAAEKIFTLRDDLD